MREGGGSDPTSTAVDEQSGGSESSASSTGSKCSNFCVPPITDSITGASSPGTPPQKEPLSIIANTCALTPPEDVKKVSPPLLSQKKECEKDKAAEKDQEHSPELRTDDDKKDMEERTGDQKGQPAGEVTLIPVNKNKVEKDKSGKGSKRKRNDKEMSMEPTTEDVGKKTNSRRKRSTPTGTSASDTADSKDAKEAKDSSEKRKKKKEKDDDSAKNPSKRKKREKAQPSGDAPSKMPKTKAPRAENSGDVAGKVAGGLPGSREVAKKSPTPAKPKQTRAPREVLKENDTMKSGSFTWRVIKLLGSGGFGDVYKVTKDEKKEYAMKTETAEGHKLMLRLKIEVTVLSQCAQVKNPARREHFVEMIDKGKNDKYKFVIMSLVGPSLEDIRKQYLVKKFSRSTVMQVASQTLQSLWDLHDIGWLHRDIKPANFAVGIGESENIIYILDFGIAKKMFNNNTRELKKPRARVKFLGTLRFASRACHNCEEQARKDDVEVWLYMVFDLMDEDNGLPWKRAPDRSQVPVYKERLFKHGFPENKQYAIIPKDFKRVLNYINTLTYSDEPDYRYIQATLVFIAHDALISLDKKLDWVGKLDKKKDSLNPKDEATSSDNRQSGSEDSDSSESRRKKQKKSSSRRTKKLTRVKSKE